MKRLALVIVLGACASPPPASPPAVATVEDAGAPPAVVVEAPPRYPAAPDDSDAMILQRTACHGRCPIYSVGITSNGNVHFYGEMFTKKRGYAFATIPREKVAALYEFLAEHPVDPALKKYPAAPDRAGAFVVLHRKGVTTRLDPPGAIAAEIDRVAATEGWVVSDKRGDYDRGEPVPAAAALAMLGRQVDPLAKCATAPTEVSLTLAITELGAAQVSSASGKKESDSQCINKVVASFRFPLGAAPVAPLTMTIGK